MDRISNFLLNDNIEVSTINGHELSVLSKPGAIPVANATGTLDISWGISSGGSGGTPNAMDRTTYDSDADGKVNKAEIADKLDITNATPNKVWATDSLGEQTWRDYKQGDMVTSTYDINSDGKVNAADKADEIAGNPLPNRVYGTNNLGVKGFHDLLSDKMIKTNYDTNSDGKVNASDTADKIAGTPGSNLVYGTNDVGIQGFYNLLTGLMTVAQYDPDKDGKVNASVSADYISGNPGQNKIYGTNDSGVKGWFDLGQISGTADMRKSVYDTNNNGKVDKAEQADLATLATEAVRIKSMDTAPNRSFYGKDISGLEGFYTIFETYPNIMTTTTFATNAFSGSGFVDKAIEANKITTSVNDKDGYLYMIVNGFPRFSSTKSIQYGMKVSLSTYNEITTNNESKILWNVLESNTHGMVSDMSTFVIPNNISLINIQCSVTTSQPLSGETYDNEVRKLIIKKNNEIFAISTIKPVNDFNVNYISIPNVKVSLNDKFEVYLLITNALSNRDIIPINSYLNIEAV